MSLKPRAKRPHGHREEFHLKEKKLPELKKNNQLEKFNSRRFKIIGALSGWHSGLRLIIQRKKAWVDLEVEGGSDIVTDFRLHSSSLGEVEAAFFGFEYFNADIVAIPSPSEITSALATFNSRLREDDIRRLKTGFAPSTVETAVHRFYVDQFFRSGKLPLSFSGRQLFHDIVSHGLHGFYVNNELFESLGRKHELWRKFSMAKRAKLSPENRKLFVQMESSFYTELAYDLDTTSNLTFDFVPRYKLRSLIRDNVRRLPDKVGTAARGIPETLMDSSRHGLSSREFFDIWLARFNTERKNFPNPVETVLRSYLNSAIERNPTLDRGLSFNFGDDVRSLRLAMKIDDQKRRETALARITLAKPFIERVKYVRRLVRSRRRAPSRSKL